MTRRIVPLAFALCLVTTTVGCATSTTSSTDDSNAAYSGTSPAANATALVTLLNESASLRMPSLGVTNGANTLSGKALLAPLRGTLLDELRLRASEPLPTLANATLEGNFGLRASGIDLTASFADDRDKTIAADDKSLALSFGLDRAEIKSYLLDSVVAPGAKSRAASLLAAPASYAHLSFADTGSEIDAQEIFLIQPVSLPGQVIVFYVGYAEA